MEGRKGEENPQWKGNGAKIQSMHIWLKKHYGKPTYCMNSDCRGKSKIFDWCKKTESNYTHDRNDYLWLCRSCHRKYDWTKEKQEKAIKNLIWYRQYETTGRIYSS